MALGEWGGVGEWGASSSPLTISLNHINSTSNVNTPTIVRDSTISLTSIPSTFTSYTPTLSTTGLPEPLVIEPTNITPTSAVHELGVSKSIIVPTYIGSHMTYLEYTNIILQGANEVPLTAQQFANARGLHQFAKEAINRVYFDIVGEYQWPWMQDATDSFLGTPQLSGEKAVPLVTKWTTIPVINPYKDAVDWSTVYYTDSEEVKHNLTVLNWQEYVDRQQYIESSSTIKYLVQSADGRSMGLVPFPEDPSDLGDLFYRVWTRPSRFEYATDVIPMPIDHYNVLVDGAIHHLWSFRGNLEQSQLAYARFEKGLKKMKQKYSNQSQRMRFV